MNNNFQDMIKQSIAAKAALEPINSWIGIYQNPALKAVQSNKLLTSSISEVMQQMFKKPAHFDSVSNFNDIVQNRTIKGIGLFNNQWWSLTNAIATNQHSISAAIEKTVTIVDAYEKAKGISKTITGLGSFFETTFPFGYSSKLATLETTLKGLSSQIAFRGYNQFGTEFLENFSTATDEAVAITRKITEKEYTTKDDIKELETFIGETIEDFSNSIKEKIEKTAKSPFALVSLWVAIIGTLLTIFTICQSLLQTQNSPHEDAATTEEIQQLKQYVDEQFKEALNEASIKAKTRITCHLRYKPSGKSMCISCLKPGEIVHIIEGRHKWVRITVIDAADNLPITAWILRKYLIREQ